MQRLRLLGIGLAAVSLVGATACSGGGAAAMTTTPASVAATRPDGAQQITLTVGNNMSFDPSTITLHAGQPVELLLHNDGFLPHDFTLTDGVSQPVKITAAGGQTSSATFSVDSPGTYSFVCSMPGHAAAGMRGTIVAQ